MSMESQENYYFNYWGKAKKSFNGETAYHLLVFHSFDVAAVGYEFLQKNSFVRGGRRLCWLYSKKTGLRR